MDQQGEAQARSLYVILNPVAGNSSVEEIREKLESLCTRERWEYEVYETTGHENIADLARAACQKGANLVIAAGGDGTVSAAVNGVVGTDIPLGILPVGTGNGLARAMGIPLDLDGALELIANRHQIIGLDAMQVGDKYYILNVSAGISADAMEKTEPEQKRRWGMLAYLRSVASSLSEKEPGIFQLELDGLKLRVQATEVLISNSEILQSGLDFFGERSQFSDGKLEVNILTATNAKEYLRLAWNMLVDQDKPNPDLTDLSVHKKIVITGENEPQPTQGDGELIGETPLEVILVPGAVHLIVPEVDKDKSAT